MDTLKKSATKRIIVWSVVSGILIAVFAIGLQFSASYKNISLFDIKLFGSEGGIFDDYRDYNAGYADLDVEKVKAIDIDWYKGSINFTRSDDDKLHLTENYNGEAKLRWKLDADGTLHVRYNAKKVFFFNTDSSVKSLGVKIPANAAFSEITVNTASADVHAGELNTYELNVNTASGITEITKLTAANANINSVSGNVQLGGMVTDRLDIETVSGNSTIEAVFKDGDFETVSGVIEAHITNAASSVEAETISGDCCVYFSDKPTGFKAGIESVSGKLYCEFAGNQLGDSFTYGDGRIRISLESVSGNLNISSEKQLFL